ncbi:hypothetical protein [Bradyrhizobium sp. UFLA05-112]
MLQSRRGFLIGAGSLLTAAFVSDACSFIRRTSQPLLASPLQVVETMYWHEIPDEGFQLTLGPWSFAPPPPTWREFFVSEDIPHRTDKEIETICCSHLIEPGDFNKPVQRRYWEDWFDTKGGPLAKAYHLLEKIDLGPARDSGRGPLLEFNVGSHPGDNTHYVNAKDMLSLSLLQARLIDLGMPIKIAEGA